MSKRKMNPIKKYAVGTGAKGMDLNNYVITPAEAMNDYNIMLGKVEAKALQNPWLPIVAAVGGAAQSFIGSSGSLLTKKPGDEGDDDEGDDAAMGMNNVQDDVEVEGGEMYETPQGQVGEFEGPSHEQGGIPLEVGEDVEEGTKVYSDRLKVGDKTLAERKATREKQIANLEKIASQSLVDQAVKNAAQRKMMAIQKEEAADLQFQEQVNNIQAMADNMVMAFGTGMAGIQDNPIGESMRYGYGSGSEGVMKYPWGTPPFGVKKNPYADPLNYDTSAIKNLHDALGILPSVDGYGTAVGPKTLKAYQDFAIPYMEKQGYSNLTAKNFPDISRFYKDGKVSLPNQGEAQALGLTQEGSKYTGPDVPFLEGQDFSGGVGFKPAQQSLEGADPFAMTAGEDWAKANPLPEGMSEAMPTGIDFKSEFFNENNKPVDKTVKEPSKFMEALGNSTPAIGDMTKLIGNYLGMTAGMKNAAEQRSTDITHTNVFKNVGKESQKLLDNAKQGIETNKAQAMVKATTVGRGGKKAARNSARGVNQMRGMDWLYDTALQQQIADISAGAAQQISGIDVQKSGVAMSADQLKGQGEYQAAMANEAAKDAYYTALGLGRKDFATGMQQSGADLNDMKTNKILEKLLSQSGEYAGMTAKGEFYGKPTKVNKTSGDEEIELQDSKGNTFKVKRSVLANLKSKK